MPLLMGGHASWVPYPDCRLIMSPPIAGDEAHNLTHTLTLLAEAEARSLSTPAMMFVPWPVVLACTIVRTGWYL